MFNRSSPASFSTGNSSNSGAWIESPEVNMFGVNSIIFDHPIGDRPTDYQLIISGLSFEPPFPDPNDEAWLSLQLMTSGSEVDSWYYSTVHRFNGTTESNSGFNPGSYAPLTIEGHDSDYVNGVIDIAIGANDKVAITANLFSQTDKNWISRTLANVVDVNNLTGVKLFLDITFTDFDNGKILFRRR